MDSYSLWSLNFFKIPLPQKVGAQVFDEIGSTTLTSCGFQVVKSDPSASEPGPRPPVSGPVPSSQMLTALLEGQSQLKSELAKIKVVQSQLTTAFAEVKAAIADRMSCTTNAMMISLHSFLISSLKSFLLRLKQSVYLVLCLLFLLTHTILVLFLLLFLTMLDCELCYILVILFIAASVLAVYFVTCMVNILPASLSVLQVIFLHYPSGDDCKPHVFLLCSSNSFFDDAKRGKVE